MMKVPLIALAGVWGLASAWSLVAELQSGVMRTSLGTGRVGEVSRRARPARFWTYAIVNVLIAAICALLVSAMVFSGPN
jgi:hypothetical protein